MSLYEVFQTALDDLTVLPSRTLRVTLLVIDTFSKHPESNQGRTKAASLCLRLKREAPGALDCMRSNQNLLTLPGTRKKRVLDDPTHILVVADERTSAMGSSQEPLICPPLGAFER